MALNEQMKEAIQADIADESSKKERIAKQVEGLKSTGKFIGETAVESIPGVSEGIAVRNVSRDLGEGDYVGAGIETVAGLAGLAPAGGDVLAKGLRKFNKTRKAYKLFTKGKDGNLYPLFVDADTPVRQGEFIDAVIPKAAFKAPNGKFYVPSKGTGGKKGTGDSIEIPDDATRQKLIEEGFLPKGSKAKTVKAVAMRPGWHAGDSPAAPHIGNEYKGKKYRSEDQVWAEVEMPADTDWQTIANSRASIVKSGKRKGEINVKEAEITDQLPDSGFYRYKTNPNMQGNWLISGQMKVNRVLDADEVKRLNKEAGSEDLPTLNELKAKDMAKGGTVMDDYQFAELDMDQTQNFAGGGMPKQMELFEPVTRGFDEGGLMDEGGTVDPVSGNDVPVGSTQEEVRDDIPAQLSEGEFVLPADVVRYFGLETIMKMRDEAKAGLAKMEAMGQMGNSEEAVLDDDVPFSMEDLDMEDDGVLEYSQGGVVKAQAGTFVQPQGFTGIGGYQPSQFAGYTPQYTPYTPPQTTASQTAAQQYTPPQQQAVPTMTQQTPTFTGFTGSAAPSSGGYDEMKTYVNSSGQEMQIPFKNGSPIYPIPEGYSLKGDTVKTAQTTTTTDTGTKTAQVQDSGEDEPEGPFAGKQTVNLGGTAVKEFTREGLNTYRPGQVKGSTKYAIGSSSSVTGDLSKRTEAGKTGVSRFFSSIAGDVADFGRGFINQDQKTLTKEDGSKITLSEALFSDIMGDRFSGSTNQILSDVFDTQVTIEKNFGENYSKDIDNRQAKQLAKEAGIEYKGQSLAELIVTGVDSQGNRLKDSFDQEQKVKKEAQVKAAQETGSEKREEREQAAQSASKYGIDAKNPDGSTKSTAQLRSEIADALTAQALEAQRAASQRAGRDDDDSGPDQSTYAGSQAYGAETYGISGLAKGGLAKQMKQSGLASKK